MSSSRLEATLRTGKYIGLRKRNHGQSGLDRGLGECGAVPDFNSVYDVEGSDD
jgi:hypothetical protein